MRRALAEIELYTAAIENAHQFEFSDNTGESPSHVFFDCWHLSGTSPHSSGFFPQPQPDEMSDLNEFHDDVSEDMVDSDC